MRGARSRSGADVCFVRKMGIFLSFISARFRTPPRKICEKIVGFPPTPPQLSASSRSSSRCLATSRWRPRASATSSKQQTATDAARQQAPYWLSGMIGGPISLVSVDRGCARLVGRKCDGREMCAVRCESGMCAQGRSESAH